MAPENGWLEYDRFLLGWPIFRGYVSFRECTTSGHFVMAQKASCRFDPFLRYQGSGLRSFPFCRARPTASCDKKLDALWGFDLLLIDSCQGSKKEQQN